MREKKTQTANRSWHFLILCIGIALSCCAFHWQKQLHMERSEKNFDRIANENFSYIQSNLQWHIGSLKNIGSFFKASNWVDADEFSLFTVPLIEREKLYEGLGWVTRLDKHNAEQLLMQLREKEPDFSNNALKDISYPVHILSHFISGLNYQPLTQYTLVENQSFLDRALSKAADNKAASFVFGNLYGFMRANSNNEDIKKHLMIVHPVFTDDEKKQQLRGFSFNIIDMDILIKKALSNNEKPYININVYRLSQDNTPDAIYGTQDSFENYEYEGIITLADQKLILHFSPTHYFLDAHKNYNAYFTLFALLGITFMVFLYLRQTVKHIFSLQAARDKAGRTQSSEIRFPRNNEP